LSTPKEHAVPKKIDESAHTAHALVTSAHDLLSMVDNRRFYSTHDAAEAMRRSMDDIDRRLALRGGLLRELDLRLDADERSWPAGLEHDAWMDGTEEVEDA
jgi:hypothetical protein